MIRKKLVLYFFTLLLSDKKDQWHLQSQYAVGNKPVGWTFLQKLLNEQNIAKTSSNSAAGFQS